MLHSSQKHFLFLLVLIYCRHMQKKNMFLESSIILIAFEWFWIIRWLSRFIWIILNRYFFLFSHNDSDLVVMNSCRKPLPIFQNYRNRTFKDCLILYRFRYFCVNTRANCLILLQISVFTCKHSSKLFLEDYVSC